MVYKLCVGQWVTTVYDETPFHWGFLIQDPDPSKQDHGERFVLEMPQEAADKLEPVAITPLATMKTTPRVLAIGTIHAQPVLERVHLHGSSGWAWGSLLALEYQGVVPSGVADAWAPTLIGQFSSSARSIRRARTAGVEMEDWLEERVVASAQ